MEIILSLLKAFLVGGIICIIGQLLIDLTRLTPAKILVSFVILGVILGATGIYKPIAEWAGAGATLPLLGFGYALADGTREAIRENGMSGILSGPLSSASIGTMAAIICGLTAAIFCRSKDKS